MATKRIMLPTNATIFLRHTSGATHAYGGRRLGKLFRALERGEGGEILTSLVCNGYMETMGGRCVDSLSAAEILAELGREPSAEGGA